MSGPENGELPSLKAISTIALATLFKEECSTTRVIRAASNRAHSGGALAVEADAGGEGASC